MEIWYLENLDILHLFCPKKMRALEDHIQLRKFKKGAQVSLSEMPKGTIYFLHQGNIRIASHDSTGHDITKAILSRGEVFGAMQSDHSESQDSLHALSAVKIYALTVDQLQKLIRTHSGFYLFCMKLCRSHRLEMERRLPFLVNKDARSRIIELIEELINTRGYKVGAGWMIKNFVTEKQIAKRTATCRHTVVDVLKELREKDIIAYQRCQLVIKQPEALKKGRK